MCESCWHQEGAPKINHPRNADVKRMFKTIYEHNEVGGNLHIVLDDMNVEDEHIQYCVDEAIPENYHKLSPEVNAIEKELGELLLTMTEQERYSALAYAEGWWE